MTAQSQMPRTVGLAYASVVYRKLADLGEFKEFSHNGDEIAWGSIGNASTAEGMFWESVNAIGAPPVRWRCRLPSTPGS